MNDKITIRGVNFDNVNMDEAVGICAEMLMREGCHVIHTPNAEIVQLCVEDRSYYELINSADLIIPDGAGVILASKLLGTPLRKGKVAGIELCENLIGYAAENKLGVYFLGGKPGIAETAAANMSVKYPGLTVSGCHDGYFAKVDSREKALMWKNGVPIDEDAAVIKEINDSGASILLCCLGVPKQEIWMNCHRDELKVRLAGGFGGSFDIFAGAAERAPEIMIRLNLEWLYRLIKEPKRIGRMMKLPKFVFGTLFARLTGRT